MRQSGRLRHRDRVLILLVGGCILLLLLYMVGSWLEEQGRKPEMRSDHTLRYSYEPTIEVDGKNYRRRNQVTTILLIGVDKESDAISVGYRNGGQADFLRLIVIDDKAQTVSQLQIDRDTMTPITILGVTGKPSGTRNAQICLSHGFGDGGAQSSELTVEAVSNLLLDMDIDFYMTLDMDGISVLNDWVGGVTVSIPEDLSIIDPAMKQGATVTLLGDQAEAFVRSRREVSNGTNASRMERQQIYVSAFTVQLEQKISDDQSQINSMLEVMDAYLLTNMTQGRIINEFWAARDYDRLPLIEPTGIHSIGSDGFMEFEMDMEAIQQTVLDLLYEEVK